MGLSNAAKRRACSLTDFSGSASFRFRRQVNYYKGQGNFLQPKTQGITHKTSMQSDQKSAKKAVSTGRLAPSPTGGLHLGNARTFLFAWLLARHSGGRMIFRMEDLDATRARDEAAAAAIEDLRWIGLTWDEGPDVGGPAGPYVQSQRSVHYQNALDLLIEKEVVYPCTCTRADVARAASAPHAGENASVYPGTCAALSAAAGLEYQSHGRSFSWRFRTSGRVVNWYDFVLGPQRHEMAATGGDFIIARSGSIYSYQLAVVVDDALMGVNQVVRGSDLVESTPRQILVQEALGFSRPEYWHLGLVLDSSHKRLAKRDQSVKIAAFKGEQDSADRLGRILKASLGWDDSFWSQQAPENFSEAIMDWKKHGLTLDCEWVWIQ